MRKVKEADEVVRELRVLLASRGNQLVREERLRRLLRRLEAIQEGNHASAGQLVKLISEISKTVCEEFKRCSK